MTFEAPPASFSSADAALGGLRREEQTKRGWSNEESDDTCYISRRLKEAIMLYTLSTMSEHACAKSRDVSRRIHGKHTV